MLGVGASKPTIISLMGAGHSGSTVLDIVLGNHPNIEGVGELHKLPRSGWVRNDNRRCACGSPIHDCPRWTEVRRRWTEKVGDGGLSTYIGLQHRFERSRSLWPRLLFERAKHSTEFSTYAEMTAALYDAIHDVSGRGIIVDSSKPPIRNYALLLNDHIDVRFIHLVRDGRGVVWSKLKSRARDVDAGVPADRPSTPSWRTSLGWLLANLESEWVAREAGPGRAVRLRYEAFVAHPDRALTEIGLLIEQDLSGLASNLMAGRPMKAGHNMGGNRLRLSSSIVLRPDFEWSAKLPPTDRRTFWRLAGWLATRYGYAR